MGHEVVTRELVFSLRTKKGGWTRQTLSALGVEWPPSHGWIDRLIGKPVDKTAMAKLKAARSRKERLRDIPVFTYDEEEEAI